MKYKLLHKIFGWDYIHWENYADSGIARLCLSADGELYYWRYKTTKVLDKIPKDSAKITWLTSKPEKYIK